MTTLFISDLHLHPARPAVIRCFIAFLATLGNTRALYILGDLFDAWAGDDHPEPAYTPVKQALKQCTAAGTPVYLLHGNRDFLLGARFARETGCTLLEDPSVISLNGRRTLLMHGDSLCTDDRDYQALRARLRSPQWQQQALSLPLEERLQFARQARELSAETNRGKDDYLMDANPAEIQRVFDTHRVELLIHGHTHRPGIHRLTHNGRQLQRVVLGDWYEQGSVLRVADGQLELASLPV
jgi:UDP-2,3-diacylglucosamine hydrolase